MPFKRQWDSSCPRVWSTWETDGVRWTIQDLPPEDDEEAAAILCKHLAEDEPMCKASNLVDDKKSLLSIRKYWDAALKQRVTLACYADKGGQRALAALNCLIVSCKGEDGDLPPIEGKAWINVYEGLSFPNKKVNSFKEMGTDVLLYGLGLVVKREYRGARLGARLLAAREPLCKETGIKATTTVFTGPISQKSAINSGFITLYTYTMTDLAEAGLNYPKDDWVFKLMYIKY